ncbi:hypothetical protein ACFE04_000962 [Oxalis oulophora]
MKKLYRKSTVHPSPPITSDHLSFLPVAILTLAAALSPEDKEVLAYLLSCSSSSSSSDNYTTTKKYKSPPSSSSSNGTVLLNHTSPLFNCSCFGCYMSYWVRWDSSPNRQLIHEIIDAYEEDELLLNNNNNKNNDKKKNKTKSKKDRKNNKGGSRNKASSSSTVVAELGTELTRGKVELGTTESGSVDRVIIGGGGGDGVEEVNNKGGSSSSSVRSFMGFVGEKIWGVIWN